jgi:TolB-like protein/DNA-binding winged helix-turn-helix (wHTH) protein
MEVRALNDPSTTVSGRYRFADLTIDLGQRRVQRGGNDIELPKLSFDLLAALVLAAPDSPSTDDLMDRVWAGSVVSVATVAKRAELLRQALGDDSREPRYVALVRGHGYRLVPDVVAIPVAGAAARRNLRPLALAALGLLVIAAVSWVVLRPTAAPPEQSIAVLPFLAFSADAGDELFADGLTEELSHELARGGDLKVTGRTSSFYFKGRNEDLRDIGETLGVANLLEGSVRRSGDTLRVTAQLISAEDGFHLWSETYDRKMDDALDIQREIARSVASRLRASLAGTARPGTGAARPGPDAYALYLRAVSLSPYGVGKDLAEAQRLIDRVVELDPGFASGWNRRAAVHGRRMFFGDPGYPHSPEEGMRIMLEAVDKALAIDPDSAEAYANLGGIAWVFEGDAMKAAPLIEKSISLDPWNLDIVAFAAEFAKFIGRQQEALALEEVLVDRDPLCTNCRFRLAMSYMYTGRYRDAERELRTLRGIEGQGYLWNIGVALLHEGKPEEALATFDQMIGENMPEYIIEQGRAMALYDLGREVESAVAIDALIEGGDATRALAVAQALAYVDRRDEAFQLLNGAVPDHAIALQTLYPSPLFNKLHPDPRWHELLENIGRAPEQVARIPFTLTTTLSR